MKRSSKEYILAYAPVLIVVGLVLFFAFKYINPAPPKKVVIAAGTEEGDYYTYAKLYQELMKEDGIELEIRQTQGTVENLKLLAAPQSGVDAAFLQDGMGSSDDYPALSSLGSLYYEPIWIFYREKLGTLSRLHQLVGKRIAIGHAGGGTEELALKLLKAAGVDQSDAVFTKLGWDEAARSLREGKADAAFFLATPEDPVIDGLIATPGIKLMSMDQAEAITRNVPFLHHLVLPHGTLDLKRGLPAVDMDLVSPTAVLLVKDSLHPALQYLLLKAAGEVHSDAGIFEKKNEFPIDKDFSFPLSDEAKRYYKSGVPFWKRYLPFWLATLAERFVLVFLPTLFVVLPVFRLIPRYLDWRVKSRIFKRYGELKFLETQLKSETHVEKIPEYLTKLDAIEERVNQMKAPLDVSDHLYSLREHIEFVRAKIKRIH